MAQFCDRRSEDRHHPGLGKGDGDLSLGNWLNPQPKAVYHSAGPSPAWCPAGVRWM
jgi:hypothetical protein